jgi:hypothetical protein
MDTTVQNYITAQPRDRQSLLSGIHSVIVEGDKTVIPVVKPMMGKEMIIYEDRSFMKYALAGVKNYMSLHVLPMYGSKILFSKYQTLLPAAKFQKGCINFSAAEEMPLEILRQLISDCSTIDLLKIRENYLKEKKQSKSKK